MGLMVIALDCEHICKWIYKKYAHTGSLARAHTQTHTHLRTHTLARTHTVMVAKIPITITLTLINAETRGL